MYTWMKQNDENTENSWNNLFILQFSSQRLILLDWAGGGFFFTYCNVSCQIHYTFFVRKPKNIEYVARKMLKSVVQFLKRGMFFLGCTQLL